MKLDHSPKVWIPLPRGAVLPQRLLRRLDEGLAGRLTVVAAPAGYGKTVLVSGWTHRTGVSTAWVTLDEADNEPAQFWRSMREGIRRALPTLPLWTGTTPYYNQETAASLLARDLASWGGRLLLVLDEFERISAPAVHKGVQALLRDLPPATHLVIIGRSKPPLPLTRLRTAGLAAVLGAAELRLKGAEAEALVRAAVKGPVDPASLKAVVTAADGWAMGLRLLAEHPRQHPSGRTLAVQEYFEEEVLGALSPRLQEFVLVAGALGTFCAELCAAAAGSADGHGLCDELLRLNLFVTPLDEDGRWYRIHPLLGEYLAGRLLQLAPNRFRDVHLRAARWFAGNGRFQEALRHAMEAQDFPYAADLLEQQSRRLWLSGDAEALLQWIERLPAGLLAGRPALLLARGWAFVHTGEHRVAGAAAEDALRNGGSEGEAAALLARAAAMEGDQAQTEAWSRRALDFLPLDSADLRGEVLLNLGHTLSLRGDSHEAAAHAFARAHETALYGENPRGALLGLQYWSQIRLEQGRLAEARSLAEEAARLVDRRGWGGHPASGIGSLMQAQIAYEQNDLDRAVRAFEAAITQGECGGEVKILVRGHFGLLRTWLALDKPDQARAELERASRLLPLSAKEAWQALLSLRTGQWQPVARWLRQQGAALTEPPQYSREHVHLMLARYHIARREGASLVPLLRGMTALAENHGRLGRSMTFRALLAAAHAQAGDQASAAAQMAQVHDAAWAEGYVRTILDEGPPVVRLMRPAIRAGAETLSDRECEVLRLLAAGCSNQEIAQRLILTVGTVKSHLHHIYGKLDVRSRTQAVARGKEFGLLG